MAKVIKSIIQLRRDHDYNFELVKNTFIPANGEVVLVDTAIGLRAKVGDGRTTYGQLTWTDSRFGDFVIHGFYKDNEFYYDANFERKITAAENKLYIDSSRNTIFHYDNNTYTPITGSFSDATSVTAGVVKLYNTTGENTDGTMTQKAITEELNARYKISANYEEEALILTI